MTRVGMLWLSLCCVGLGSSGCDFRVPIASNDGGTGGGQGTGGGATGGGATGGGASGGGMGGGAAGGGATGGGAAGGGASGGGMGGGAVGGGSAGGGTGGGSTTDGGSTGGGGGACVPRTCEELGATCGTAPDRCGTELLCGSCQSPLGCGLGGTPNVCGMGAVQGDGCSAAGWCWVNPLPQGNTLFAVWARTSSDWWAVGARGTVLHGTGTTGGLLVTGATGDLRAVHGSAADDVWAVGDEGALHWNGAGWSHYPVPWLRDVFVVSPNEAWATGSLGGTQRWNGTRWASATAGANSIWGASGNDLWLVGGAGLIKHWDGTAWTTVPSGTTEQLWSVRGRSSTDVWAGGDNGTLLHWNGAVWQPVTISASTARLSALWAAGPTQLFVGSSIWNGSSLTSYPAAGNVASVYGSSGSDVWAVGAGGNLAHFDGTSWTALPQRLPNTLGASSALWAGGPSDVRITSASGTLRWDGSTLATLGAPAAAPGWARLWGPDVGNLWAVSSSRVYRWDQSLGWVAQTLPASQTDAFAITGSSSTDVWVWGTSAISHFDGASWASRPALNDLSSMISFGANDAWAISAGIPFHWNGSNWSSYAAAAVAQGRLWGASSNDVWAVGASGTAQHWDGAGWAPSSTGTTAALHAISGTRTDDVWAVGANGTIVHWDGTGWAAAPSLAASNLYAVVAVPDGGVWASGDYGTVIRKP